ncbi:YhgE/Pip domain-containing protein [Brachybacterium sp. Z12]|uniref:YhgE/Pip domain-containing protein n=1 Tax=Brachybacterium sp. Z12 TaxID=2759167 RepID=UPI00223BB127|nr:YhgE/Pip family protein [Brachybacterium sp. Z12]
MSRFTHPRTLIVVLVLPLLVAALGMWALSGRVDRLDTVPAAVVNLDKGAEIEDADGEVQTVPFGRLLAGALTQPGTVEGQDAPETTGFDWQLTSQDDAEEGLQDGSYSAVVVIPENFSEDLASIGTPEATQAILEVVTNDASGQINALVGTAVTEASASTTGGTMAKQYLDGLYLGFNDLGDGFREAADGAEELSEGTTGLDDGTQELAQGSRDLAEGTQDAADGAEEFSGGVWTLADGTWQSADGTRTLADGLDELATGSEARRRRAPAAGRPERHRRPAGPARRRLAPGRRGRGRRHAGEPGPGGRSRAARHRPRAVLRRRRPGRDRGLR